MAFHTAKDHKYYWRLWTALYCCYVYPTYDDSEIAKRISCVTTKTEAVVNNIFAPLSITLILQQLENIQFLSVSTDGSNHESHQIFPIVIQYFDH